ncbi:MAG: M48 family metallopeptidase [Candidatus Undinarchaeales archaeon]|jgi:hypothetical protein|nr:M48 family metallopeptidase [Candidatus Undinarchaeales archaeon]MDP7492581.1 M48 family metallopeptidase [Candidatus Undinarchaeales archaeon]
MHTEPIVVEGRTYAVRIHLESRRNCRVSVGKQGVSIRMPRWMPRADKEWHLVELRAWAVERITREPERFAPRRGREYHDGHVLRAAGEEYVVRLNLEERRTSSGRIRGNELHLHHPWRLPTDELRTRSATVVSRLLADRHLPRVRDLVDRLNREHFQAKVNQVRLKHQRSRWGSCSSRGNINLSTRLLMAPPDVLEYVIVHELAHLKVRKHDRKFWQLVERVVPDYKEKVAWLREHGRECDL